MQDCYFDRSTADLSMMKEGRRKKMKAGNVASDVRSTTTMNAQKTQKPPFLSPLFFYLSLTLYPLSISPQYIFCSFLLYIRRFSIIAFQINRRPRQSINDYRLPSMIIYLQNKFRIIVDYRQNNKWKLSLTKNLIQKVFL